MKKIILVIIALSYGLLSIFAQSNASASMSFHIEPEVIPPYLVIEEGSIHFVDEDNNNFINANEKCRISFTLRNKGKGNAYGCTARIRGEGSTNGLSYNDIKLPMIKAGQTYNLDIPISSSMDTKSGEVEFSIVVDEPNGFGTDPITLTVGTRKFDAPFIEIVSYKILSDETSQLRKKSPFRLQVLLQNTDQGIAHDVRCSIKIPNNVFPLDEGKKYFDFPSMRPNEKKLLEFEFQTNANVNDNVDIEFKLSESYGKYAKNASIPLHFGQAISGSTTNIRVTGQERQEVNINKGSLVSDVDENIPISYSKSPNTFVLIIANENYQQVSSVPFALNDGNIFKEYCIKTLGIGEKHIKYLTDATGNQIKASINWLANLTEAFDNPQIIVYYAGHGIPDESNKSSYILPVDGSGTDVTTGYKLDDLYITLGNMPASHITVFMDACFSGSKREDGMLASARGVALKAKSGVPQGNMVVFSAAQGDETAYPNREQQHGLFTYYLLKKLQETEGNVALKDLGDYITKQVSQQSILVNNKKQTPCVTPSATLGNEWQNWKLK